MRRETVKSLYTVKLRDRTYYKDLYTIQNSTATADIGGWACAEALGDGVPEYEVALAGTQAMVRRIAELYPNSELMDSGWHAEVTVHMTKSSFWYNSILI